jgi:hypothetical protein
MLDRFDQNNDRLGDAQRKRRFHRSLSVPRCALFVVKVAPKMLVYLLGAGVVLMTAVAFAGALMWMAAEAIILALSALAWWLFGVPPPLVSEDALVVPAFGFAATAALFTIVINWRGILRGLGKIATEPIFQRGRRG